MAQKFKKTLTLAEMTAKNLSVKAGVYTKAFEYIVGAQQQITWGNGSIRGGVDDRGKLNLTLKNSSNNVISGWVRLAITDANEINKVVVFEERTENLSSYPLEEYAVRAKEDSKLIIEVMPDADNTIDMTKSDGLLPITIYY